MDVRIKTIGPIQVARIRHVGRYAEVGPCFERLFRWASGDRRADRPGPHPVLGRPGNGAVRPAALRRLRGTAHRGRPAARHRAGSGRRGALRALPAGRSVRRHFKGVPAAARQRRVDGRPAMHTVARTEGGPTAATTQLRRDSCTGRVIRAARTVGNGAHGARLDITAAAVADRRCLDALRDEPRAAIGAAMRSSSRFNGQRSFASKPSLPSLHVARDRCMVTRTRWERGGIHR